MLRTESLPPAVEDVWLELPNSSAVLYFFIRNPDRFDKLKSMSEREAIQEIERVAKRVGLPNSEIWKYEEKYGPQ